jgi:hypothetical protein
MPLVFDRSLDILKMQQPPDIHTHYGHRERQATRCSHWMHPTAPYRAPLCPSCVTGRINGTLDVALGALRVAGGAEPPEDERNQQWRRAKLRYDIAKQRQSRNRVLNQLREEREQAWEEAHRRYSSQWPQDIVPAHDFVECPACASMTRYPDRFVRIQPPAYATWWEQSGGLVFRHTLATSALKRPGREQRKPQEARGPSFIRELIQDSRQNMLSEDTERRCRIELMLRRKFNLDSSFDFPAHFWETPISDSDSRRIYRERRDNELYSAYRARGNALLPIPPRSSLSHCELSEDVETDQDELEQMWVSERAAALEQKAWRVGEQVGYLYFVGDDFDGLFDWRDDFLRSNRQIIYRQAAGDTVMNEPSTASEEADSSDEEGDTEDGEDMDVDE